MAAELIQGQHLANAFLSLLPPPAKSGGANHNVSNLRTGAIAQAAIPDDLKKSLPEIFSPNQYFGFDWANLFNGDKSAYNDDHSAADMALVGFMAREGLTRDEVDLVFRASALYRDKWDEMRGETTYGQRTIAKAFEDSPDDVAQEDKVSLFDLDPNRYRPKYVAAGMPARKFAGPQIGPGVRLYPVAALSALVALGAVGKTSLLLSQLAHVAAGKKWNGFSVEQRKTVMFFCEENEDEVTRKFSAIIDEWSPAERQAVQENMLLVPLLGLDVRLSAISQGQHLGSGVAEEMIGLLNAFGLKDGLVVIDHMQGFASGDLNLSETATSICREANKIVAATGAAVVFAAHIAKANIKATTLEQGFAVGSLAFENATRQMSGMLPMPEEDAKKYGLESTRKEYVWLGLPKNSYGGTDAGVWLKKEVNSKYHTVMVNPVQLTVPVSGARKSANEKLADRIVNYINGHPRTSKNQLDAESGEDGALKASKGKVRDVLSGLLDTGVVVLHPVTDSERQQHDIPKQVKEVLRVKPAAKPADSADKQVSQAGLKPLVDKA
jgi:hypothetical protein